MTDVIMIHCLRDSIYIVYNDIMYIGTMNYIMIQV